MSRAFLQSYEIIDLKSRERKATVIHRTTLYHEKVDLLINDHLPELSLFKRVILNGKICFFTTKKSTFELTLEVFGLFWNSLNFQRGMI